MRIFLLLVNQIKGEKSIKKIAIIICFILSALLIFSCKHEKAIFTVLHSNETRDTVLTHVLAVSPLVTNEIYSCGRPDTILYFYDQYTELYNNSSEIQYLSGKIIGKTPPNSDFFPFLRQWDYITVSYLYQFPGVPNGTEYPILPGQFLIIAVDAFDHSQSCSTAVKLENADWEFFCQNGSDWDNPLVPNLINVNLSYNKDFLMSSISQGVILADGTAYRPEDNHINIPIQTTLDGIEYKKAVGDKYLSRRMDSGQITGITAYSGKSRERIEPGKDTNNSTIDLQIINNPPGIILTENRVS